MNCTRIVSALLGLPFVILVLVLGNIYVVDIAFAIIAIMCMHEYFHAFKQKVKPIQWVGYVSAALIGFVHIIPIEFALKTIGIIVPIIVTILFLHVILTNMKINVNDIIITFFGICYIALFLMFMPIIHGLENGKILVWYIPFIAWGTDIFAYVVGKTMGKHKFSKISPNKSIEGCIGGVIGSVILTLTFTFVMNTYFALNMSYTYIILISFILSVISQIGDFSASSIKRYVDIKDFSNLIPGHGGMLDRIDSVIFVAPFAYMFFMFL